MAKFKFSCTKCGECCDNRTPVPLTLQDLDDWSTKKVINNIFPYIKIGMNQDGIAMLVLDVIEESKDGDDADDKKERIGKCPMYNKETKTCLIWANRPTYCRAFPLGFNGDNYVIEMDDCPGLESVEEMDKELLKNMRDDAKTLFEGIRSLGITLPILQGVIMRTLQEENMKIMSKLSQEDMEKLGNIMQKMSGEQEETK